MRLVSRKELMSLPAGTVYSEYEPHMLSAPKAKEDTLEPKPGYSGDWWMCSLTDDFGGDSTTTCDEIEALKRGEDVPLVFGECYGRDAAFDDKQQYAVWSKADLLGLAAFLTKAAEVAK